MMCDPCFMDANQVGFVHELSWEDIKTLLDNAISIKPKRQMSVQFSGGEPTMSPYFLDAVRYAKKVGYSSVQAATNGIEFAKSPEFAKAAFEAGLRYAYLQFDGIGNAANSHRLVGNLFDVKLRAIENLHSNGVDIVPVTTIVNGVNNEQVGRIIQFALDNPKKINFLSFQPVSFTGRDEEVTVERREAQRYTLSHLAHDVKNQIGLGEPVRDWFPISFMGTFTDWADLVHGPSAEWGNLTCGCHPNCGIGMAVMIDKETKEAVPVTAFLDAQTMANDLKKVNDAGRGKFLSSVGMALALMKNYDPFKSPTHFKIADLMKKFDKTFGATGKSYGKVGADRTQRDQQIRRADRWNFLFIAGMWFQDLFNYDFRRTERCIIPYATQEGEISFCAYNTGIGWRNIIEKMHMTATLTKWYEEHGRHEIIAGGKNVALPTTAHNLVLDAEAVALGIQHDLDDAGIAKTAREEKLRARADAKKKAEENERMAALYRQHVLKEEPAGPVIQIQGLGGKKKAPCRKCCTRTSSSVRASAIPTAAWGNPAAVFFVTLRPWLALVASGFSRNPLVCLRGSRAPMSTTARRRARPRPWHTHARGRPGRAALGRAAARRGRRPQGDDARERPAVPRLRPERARRRRHHRRRARGRAGSRSRAAVLRGHRAAVTDPPRLRGPAGASRHGECGPRAPSHGRPARCSWP